MPSVEQRALSCSLPNAENKITVAAIINAISLTTLKRRFMLILRKSGARHAAAKS